MGKLVLRHASWLTYSEVAQCACIAALEARIPSTIELALVEVVMGRGSKVCVQSQLNSSLPFPLPSLLAVFLNYSPRTTEHMPLSILLGNILLRPLVSKPTHQ